MNGHRRFAWIICFLFILSATGCAPESSEQNYRAGRSPAWGAQYPAWTEAVRAVVHARLSSFERAADRQVFCPGYDRKSLADRENCWLMLISAVSKYESDFHPKDSFREPDGSYSVGLLALSPGECPNAEKVAGLQNPIDNLICGANKMANLIEQAGYIDSPGTNEGAASYWSTLRPRYQLGQYKLGYKFEICAITKHFSN